MINFRALIIFFSAILLATSVAGDGECAAGVLCKEGFCCSKSGFCGNTDEYCSPENCQSQCPDYPPPPPAVAVSDIITESVFDQLIPKRDEPTCLASEFYTYEAFLTAAKCFPDFGNIGNNETRTRELAAFFAQTSTKTTGGTPGNPDEYEWGYCYKEEPSASECVPTDDWPCAPNKSYHPRGPIGLEFNYNYGPAGKALEQDLINEPDLVSHDPILSFKTAIWYWMNSHKPGEPSCHSAMVGQPPAYRVTIDLLFPHECESEPTGYNAVNSINFYNRSTTILNVSPGEEVQCNHQRFPIPNPNNLGNVLKMPIYKA